MFAVVGAVQLLAGVDFDIASRPGELIGHRGLINLHIIRLTEKRNEGSRYSHQPRSAIAIVEELTHEIKDVPQVGVQVGGCDHPRLGYFTADFQ
jgi:hypothetical protein